MKRSYQTMSESFYLSNMSPQAPGFNRGIWSTLESYVRTWADENEEIYVVTGPVLTGTYSTIGPDQVSVPEYFYKAILDLKEPDVKGIGFILPNESS
jgi:endonuclease G